MATGVTLVTADGKGPVTASNPMPVVSGGNAPPLIYQGNGSIPSVATWIDFPEPVTTVRIALSNGSANLYINWNGTAAVANSSCDVIWSGAADVYAGYPLTTICIIGASASGSYSIRAH